MVFFRNDQNDLAIGSREVSAFKLDCENLSSVPLQTSL